MARLTKQAAEAYRLPTFHAPSRRWRFKINHHHGRKERFWPSNGQTVTPPPDVIAAAVGIQDQWRQLQADWPTIRFAMHAADPLKDWSRPAWVTAEQVANAKAEVDRQRDVNRQQHEVATAYKATTIGIDRLAEVLATLTPDNPLSPGGPWHDDRLQMLAALRPVRRQQIQHVTVREAMMVFLDKHDSRTKLETGDWIENSTYTQLRKTLLAAFGLSNSPEMQPVRNDVPIDLDLPLAKACHAL